jgi:four helix bundle protein
MGSKLGVSYFDPQARSEQTIERRIVPNQVHKVGIAEKEASETTFWLEICQDVALGSPLRVKELLLESHELQAILTTIGRKAKRAS